ncbi:plexin-B-like [Asterias rubens]|uniref:plexin-B-like n=1 Tax=Asterias rubens TaxID=7604 RepID=UPI00145544FB|nr:plexin-B-like [Asterias rubens]
MEAQRSHVTILLAECLILLGLLSSVVSAEWQGDLSSYHIASFSNPHPPRPLNDPSGPNVAGFGELSTVSLIAPGTDGPMGDGPDGGDWLYVAVTYSAEVGYRAIPPISRRILSEGSLLAALDGNTFSSVVPFSTPIQISYRSAFSFGGFTYFITSQKEDFGSNFFVSKMNRVCQTSEYLDSYTEITLQCQGSDGSVYSLVQAAHIGPAGQDLAVSLGLNAEDMVLYAVLAKNEGADGTSDVPIDQSALCVYKMSDILDAFKEAVRGCIQDGDDYSVQYLQGSICPALPVSITIL